MSEANSPFIIIRAEEIMMKRLENQESDRSGPKEKKNTWSQRENHQYVNFFKNHMEFATNAELRKVEKVFNKMTQYIPTRTSIQIKSHHQKLLQKYKTIENILRNLDEKLNTPKNVEVESGNDSPDSAVNNISNIYVLQSQLDAFEEDQARSQLNLFQGAQGSLQFGITFFDEQKNPLAEPYWQSH